MPQVCRFCPINSSGFSGRPRNLACQIVSGLTDCGNYSTQQTSTYVYANSALSDDQAIAEIDLGGPQHGAVAVLPSAAGEVGAKPR